MLDLITCKEVGRTLLSSLTCNMLMNIMLAENCPDKITSLLFGGTSIVRTEKEVGGPPPHCNRLLLVSFGFKMCKCPCFSPVVLLFRSTAARCWHSCRLRVRCTCCQTLSDRPSIRVNSGQTGF